MPHVVRKQGVLGGTALAVFLAVVHVVNDAITAILGALLPTVQERFDASPTLLALMVASYWVASSVTQPVFGALAEDHGLCLVGATGVMAAALFLSLVGVAPTLAAVFALLVIGGMGSAALHPVGTAIAGGPNVPNRALGVGFFTAGGMVGFGLGPVLILYLVARFGIDATPWLMVPGVLLACSSTCCYRNGSRTATEAGGRWLTSGSFVARRSPRLGRKPDQRRLRHLHQLGAVVARARAGASDP